MATSGAAPNWLNPSLGSFSFWASASIQSRYEAISGARIFGRFLASASANWMIGHVTWQNQRLPVMSFSALNNPELDESKKRKPNLVILNPVPGAARKVYTGLLCFGAIKQVKVNQSAAIADIPESVDKRYIEAVIKFDKKQLMIPKLPALSVAFSYF